MATLEIYQCAGPPDDGRWRFTYTDDDRNVTNSVTYDSEADARAGVPEQLAHLLPAVEADVEVAVDATVYVDEGDDE